MLKIAVLGSTAGTDLQAIIDALKTDELSAVELSVVIANKKDAYILERAKKAGFETICIPSEGKERQEHEREVLEILDKYSVDLVLLIGYMRVITPLFIDKYKNRVMNIHPSLLPAFAGGMDKNVHEEVLKSGSKVTGCTLHFVDEGIDTGQIIAQKEVPVEESDTVDSLKTKVQNAEQEVILQAIKDFRDGKLKFPMPKSQ